MKVRIFSLVISAVVLAVAAVAMAQPLGTSFTYQGRLKQSGLPANSPVDLQFSLYDSAGTGSPPTGGSQVGLSIPLTNVPVVDGLFTVSLDFGAVFTGTQRYLQIGVRPGGSAGAYTPLNARQPITGVPYAQWANLGPGGGGGDGCCDPRKEVNAINTPGSSTALYLISQPGSYYLGGNVTGVPGKNGIQVSANGVTLDLNGFALLGVSGTLDGVRVDLGNGDGSIDIAILNGSVEHWGGDGVNMQPPNANYGYNTRLTNLRLSFNTGRGIAAGSLAVVSDCSTLENGGNGIECGQYCSVTNCLLYVNGGAGIDAFSDCTITNCIARFNLSGGIISSEGAVSECEAVENVGNGIDIFAGVAVNCSVLSNSLNGIRATYSTVVDCTAVANRADGILVDSGSTIRGNNCNSSFNFSGVQGGIHATGTRNRIEGNECSNADVGIKVDSCCNIIMRNTCSGNITNNWDVVAGNKIHVVAPAAAGAVTGNSGGAALDPDPNANFTY